MEAMRSQILRRVEEGRGGLKRLRFPSPLIEPDVPISGIRLSDCVSSHSTWQRAKMNLAQTDNSKLTKHRLRRETAGAAAAPYGDASGNDRPRTDLVFAADSSNEALAFRALPEQPTSLVSGSILRRFMLTPLRHYTRLDFCLSPKGSSIVGSPTLPEIPFRRAVPLTPVDRSGASVGFFPDRAAFPVMRRARCPPHHFRSLLRVHFRYGP